MIDEKGAASEAAKVELQHAADIAALHLLQARTEAEVSDRRRGDMLSAVLDDAATAGQAAAALGISASKAIRIVAVEHRRAAAGHRGGHGLSPDAWSWRSGTAAPNSVSAPQRCGPTCCTCSLPVVAGDCDQSALTRLLSGIDAHARRSYGYRLLIGVGGEVAGLAEAGSVQGSGRSRRQPDETRSRAGRAARRTEQLIGFSELYTARMALLTLAEHTGDLDEAAGNTIRAMLEHDNANASDYVPTLKAFFNAHGNISDMAQLLHVHANTCRYRMTRIAEVFGDRPR